MPSDYDYSKEDMIPPPTDLTLLAIEEKLVWQRWMGMDGIAGQICERKLSTLQPNSSFTSIKSYFKHKIRSGAIHELRQFVQRLQSLLIARQAGSLASRGKPIVLSSRGSAHEDEWYQKYRVQFTAIVTRAAIGHMMKILWRGAPPGPAVVCYPTLPHVFTAPANTSKARFSSGYMSYGGTAELLVEVVTAMPRLCLLQYTHTLSSPTT